MSEKKIQVYFGKDPKTYDWIKNEAKKEKTSESQIVAIKLRELRLKKEI